MQNGFALLAQSLCGVNQNISAQGCQTREAIGNDGYKTRELITRQYETTLTRQREECVYRLEQAICQSGPGGDIVNLSTMTASGTQAAANTQVR